MTIERPMFPPRAESVDSFSPPPAIGQPESQSLTGESGKAAGGLSRRAALAGLAALPAAGAVTMPASALAVSADAELIALGKQLEPLVDAYYAARRPWARALVQRNNKLEERFGSPADRDYEYTPEYWAAAEELDRTSLNGAADRLHVAFEKIETIAKAIEALPCTSIEGLRAKALVAFWEVAPLCAGDTEFHFQDAYPFQRLFSAVAEVCGLNGKIAETGFNLPDICADDDQDDEEEA
jgi:hypothetical protein